MGETMRSPLFINSEQVGDVITIPVSVHDGEEEATEEVLIHYLEAGVGEPLLLIHSIGQSLFTWRNIFAELSENYRVIAIDLPGHGYSSRPDRFDYSMDAMAELIGRFLDAKGIRSAHMIGFSMGSLYMLRFLSLFPNRVANCIVISPGGLTEQMPKLIHRIGSRVCSVMSRNLFSATDVRKLLNDCVYEKEIVDDHMVRQYYQPLQDGLSREALMYALVNFDRDMVAEALLPIDHEVLVLWGKEDRWHPPSGSVYFQGVLQAGRYYLIRHAGHLLQEEAPEKLLEIIFSYIPPAVPSYNAYRYTQHAPMADNNWIREPSYIPEKPYPNAPQQAYDELGQDMYVQGDDGILYREAETGETLDGALDAETILHMAAAEAFGEQTEEVFVEQPEEAEQAEQAEQAPPTEAEDGNT